MIAYKYYLIIYFIIIFKGKFAFLLVWFKPKYLLCARHSS